MDQTVELYCGADKAFSQVAEALGYSTFTVDMNPANQPNLTGAISEILAKDIPASPLILWAAPPFDESFWSSESWERDGSMYPLTDQAQTAIDTIRETIRLVYALKPTWWFIEHPKSLLRRMPLFAGFNRGYPTRNRKLINHSLFGEQLGQSDVWTNAFWWLPDSPDEIDPEGPEMRNPGRVPPFVYAQMFDQFDNYRRTGTLSR